MVTTTIKKLQDPTKPPAQPTGMINTTAAPTASSSPAAPLPKPAAAPKPAVMPKPAAAPNPSAMTPKPAGTGMISKGVNPSLETIEGRLGKILRTDANGNYTSDVVRQAVDRQDQAFNARGLRNSSMAMQAGQEAAISKAIDIASHDATTYANAAEQQRDREYRSGEAQKDRNFESAEREKDRTYEEKTRVDEQLFNLRKDYQSAVQDISTNYQKMVDTINASNMTPADKSVAIAQAAAVRDGEMAYQNNLYAKMPNWKNEWLALAVPTGGMNMGKVTNPDTLLNIINDPAQPATVRQQARVRLNSLRSAPPPTAGGSGGNGGGGGGGVTQPTVTPINPTPWLPPERVDPNSPLNQTPWS